MTCIAAIVHEGRIIMGGDSCASDDDLWSTVGTPKVFKIQNFIIGCCGSMRMLALLRYRLKVVKSEKISNEAFIFNPFINAVIDCFKDGGFMETHDGSITGGNFLVGYQGRLYEVQDDFSVLVCQHWGAAVGSGRAAALGSLFTTSAWESPSNRILTALQAAEAIVTNVRAPFIIEEL